MYVMQIKLLPHQWDFMTSDVKFLSLIGGIGSGKTFTLAHYIIGRVIKYPKALHFIGANTYSQLRNSTMSAVFSVLEDLGIPYSYNSTHGSLEFAGGKVLCKSLTDYNMLRGIEIGSFVLDEARDLEREAFDMLMGRLRDKHVDGDLQGRIVTSPAGFNWIYDYFHKSGELHNDKEFDLIACNSMANKHLPDGYLESLRTQYSETFYKQEILGEFINLTAGKVYYAFDRDRNVSDKIDKVFGTIMIGQDFNVNPCTSVVAQIVNGKIHVFDEFYLEDSDTYQIGHAMKLKYNGATIYPDSTGGGRRSSSVNTDHGILKDYGFKVKVVHNPAVFDRVNNINRLLSQGLIVIHPRCKKLINDLEKVVWKGSKIDQSGQYKLLSHLSDGLGYLAWGTNPLRPTYTEKISITRS